MALLAIMITLGIEHFYQVLDEHRRLEWFARWGNWIEEHRTLNTPRGTLFTSLLTLLLPILLVHQLAVWMAEGGWLPELLFSVLILILSIGPKDLRRQVESVLESWSREDVEGGILHAEGLLQGEVPPHKGAVVRKLTETVLTEANSRIFTVLFWFVVLGPAAALLVRLGMVLEHLQQGERGDEAPHWICEMNRLLAWPAAHLLALSYALVGDFSTAFKQFLQHAGDWHHNRLVMRESGMGAIRLEPVDLENDEDCDLQEVWDSLEMVRRAEVTWLVVLALMILSEVG